MVSLGSALLEKTQSGGDPNLEPLSKPIFNAISQAIIMANGETVILLGKKGKLDLLFFPQKLLPLHQNKKRKDVKRIKRERKI